MHHPLAWSPASASCTSCVAHLLKKILAFRSFHNLVLIITGTYVQFFYPSCATKLTHHILIISNMHMTKLHTFNVHAWHVLRCMLYIAMHKDQRATKYEFFNTHEESKGLQFFLWSVGHTRTFGAQKLPIFCLSWIENRLVGLGLFALCFSF